MEAAVIAQKVQQALARAAEIIGCLLTQPVPRKDHVVAVYDEVFFPAGRQGDGCLGLGGGRPVQRRLLRAEFPLDDALQLLFVQIEVLCAAAGG